MLRRRVGFPSGQVRMLRSGVFLPFPRIIPVYIGIYLGFAQHYQHSLSKTEEQKGLIIPVSPKDGGADAPRYNVKTHQSRRRERASLCPNLPKNRKKRRLLCASILS